MGFKQLGSGMEHDHAAAYAQGTNLWREYKDIWHGLVRNFSTDDGLPGSMLLLGKGDRSLSMMRSSSGLSSPPLRSDEAMERSNLCLCIWKGSVLSDWELSIPYIVFHPNALVRPPKRNSKEIARRPCPVGGSKHSRSTDRVYLQDKGLCGYTELKSCSKFSSNSISIRFEQT